MENLRENHTISTGLVAAEIAESDDTLAGGSTGRAYTVVHRQVQDADEQASCLKSWEQRYDQLTPGRFSGQFNAGEFEQIYLFREQANQSIHQQGSPHEGLLTLGVPVGGDSTGWYCGEQCGLDAIFVLRGGEFYDFRTPRHHDLAAVTVNLEHFRRFVRQTEQIEIYPCSGCMTAPEVTPEKIASLREFLLATLQCCTSMPSLLQHAAMRKGLEQAVYWALLEVFSQTLSLPASVPRAAMAGSHNRQRIVDQARAYMLAHIDEPITVADLCLALGVSRRTIQYSFQDVLNLNPISFLRALRLNGVRRALKQAGPQAVVADIAACWGFWHLSHFAADYRSMFGERPSDTLRHQAMRLSQ